MQFGDNNEYLMGTKPVCTMYFHLLGDLQNYIYVTFQISEEIKLIICSEYYRNDMSQCLEIMQILSRVF